MSEKQKGRTNNPKGNYASIKGTPFKPGQSGNPGGRPKHLPVTLACRTVAELKEKDLEPKPNDTVATRIAKKLAKEALEGNIRAAKEFADRCEGTVVQRHELTGEDGGNVPISVSDSGTEEIKQRLAELTARILAREGKPRRDS